MLSCDYSYEPEAGDVCWYPPTKWSQHQRRRSPKCCSCGDVVPADTKCLVFPRYKVPDSDVELNIYGEEGEVPRAPWFMCFECGWRFLALQNHGYAIDIRDDMRALMIEHDDLAAIGNAGCL